MAQGNTSTEPHACDQEKVLLDGASATHVPFNVVDEEKHACVAAGDSSADGSVNEQANPFMLTHSAQVTYDGPEDKSNPQNWSSPLKWSVTILVSCGGFITMMSGSMLAPALPAIGHDLGMSEATAQITLSVFVLAFAFGPMILAPFAEVYGRRPVWILCGTFYSVWSIVSGFSHNKGLLVASRLLSGFGGSVDFVMSYPVVDDVWSPEERGKACAIVSFLPLLGPAMGPLIGGIITQTIGWRWIFWVAAIFSGCLMILGFFVFPETSAAKILGDKARELSKATGQHYHTEYEGPNQKVTQKLWLSINRPARLLATQPILMVISLFLAYNFGILYFVLSTFSSLYTDVYHQTTLQSGLHYIALALGYLVANTIEAEVMDRIWAHLTEKAGGETAPEYRVPLMVPSGLLMPIGLFWYGWSAEAHIHWIMPDIGAAIFGCGFFLNTGLILAYVLDSFGKYTASAMAASQLLRMIAGFAFPIFAPAMYTALGWGWANSTLALIAMVFGSLAPLILWKFGAKIRAMGKPQW
ncbi:Efflux pump [Lachnellula hyalina]|uniref:Efflux pump n=1 Tax=Lachnellula hyalina TaxID=1316788 RepID=A0A8H8U210_9HELO|nr:Efflux pump [Lachnellula hyalina]TVY28870.1 Efflux pump [Lachnellula hyalina]